MAILSAPQSRLSGRAQWLPNAHLVEYIATLWALNYMRLEAHQFVRLNLVPAHWAGLREVEVGFTGRMPADLLANAICLRNRPDFTLHEIVRPKGLLSIGTGAPDRLVQAESLVGVGHDLLCRAHCVTRRREPTYIVGDMWLADLNLGPPEATLLGVQRLLHQLSVINVDPSTFGVIALDRILGPAAKTVKWQMGLAAAQIPEGRVDSGKCYRRERAHGCRVNVKEKVAPNPLDVIGLALEQEGTR